MDDRDPTYVTKTQKSENKITSLFKAVVAYRAYRVLFEPFSRCDFAWLD